VSDLSPLTGLPRLESLYLAWGSIPNLSFVRKLLALRHLYLQGYEPANLTPLRGMTQLTVHLRRRQQIYGAELLGEGSKVVRS
jgi:hypothetical protein